MQGVGIRDPRQALGQQEADLRVGLRTSLGLKRKEPHRAPERWSKESAKLWRYSKIDSTAPPSPGSFSAVWRFRSNTLRHSAKYEAFARLKGGRARKKQLAWLSCKLPALCARQATVVPAHLMWLSLARGTRQAYHSYDMQALRSWH